MPAAAPMPDASADLDGLRTQMAAVLADARTPANSLASTPRCLRSGSVSRRQQQVP